MKALMLWVRAFGVILVMGVGALVVTACSPRPNCDGTRHNSVLTTVGVTYHFQGNGFATDKFYGGVLQFVRADSSFVSCQALVQFQHQAPNEQGALEFEAFTSRQCLRPLAGDEMYLLLFVNAPQDASASQSDGAGYVRLAVTSDVLNALAQVRSSFTGSSATTLQQFEYAHPLHIQDHIADALFKESGFQRPNSDLDRFMLDYHFFLCHGKSSRLSVRDNDPYVQWAKRLSDKGFLSLCFSAYDLTSFSASLEGAAHEFEYVAQNAKVFANSQGAQQDHGVWRTHLQDKLVRDTELLEAVQGALRGMSGVSKAANHATVVAAATAFRQAWSTVGLVTKVGETPQVDEHIFLYSHSFAQNPRTSQPFGYEIFSLVQDQENRWARVFNQTAWGLSLAMKSEVFTEESPGEEPQHFEGSKVFAESILLWGNTPVAIAYAVHNKHLAKFDISYESIRHIVPAPPDPQQLVDRDETPSPSAPSPSQPAPTESSPGEDDGDKASPAPAPSPSPRVPPKVTPPPVAKNPPPNKPPSTLPSAPPPRTSPPPRQPSPAPAPAPTRQQQRQQRQQQQQRHQQANNNGQGLGNFWGTLIQGLIPLTYTRPQQRDWLQRYQGEEDNGDGETQDPQESEPINLEAEITVQGPSSANPPPSGSSGDSTTIDPNAAVACP